MVAAFLSRFGLKSLKVGSPVLSVIEAAAQSDLRIQPGHLRPAERPQASDSSHGHRPWTGSQPMRTSRGSGIPSSGSVTISDSSFSKLSSKIYQGQPAPIVGSNEGLRHGREPVPGQGSVYLGRGTSNYEGPLRYSSKVNSGTYWTLTLLDIDPSLPQPR
jgi:hypothetical protein